MQCLVTSTRCKDDMSWLVFGLCGCFLHFAFLEVQREGVDTVPESRRLWAVLKNVAQMTAALLAQNLNSFHEKATVGFFLDVLLFKWRPEAGPPGSRIKLCIG